jgi:hypothetical protein
MDDIVRLFKKGEACRADLEEALADKLADPENLPLTDITCRDVIRVINRYLDDSISSAFLEDWADTVLNTEYFEININDEETVESVLAILCNEDDIEKLGRAEFEEIIECLENNDPIEF